MADTAQITYEHTNGNTMAFFTEDLTIEYKRHIEFEFRPDGSIITKDWNTNQRIFYCSSFLTAAQVNTLNGWLTGSVTYSGAYPRLTTVYLDGTTTLTNVEVAIPSLRVMGGGPSGWLVQLRFEEKTA